ncbi:N-acetylmuramidase domain-containing protein [Runella slithyformis]|uniref:N-acetylmuramidase domain-containing protein n=1 Tax=Runella slithyformis (strain ATCC 29530 / DSM 19594 / LMG 11500 / NCIMB 11436 / LSU 4) TaxID=761193 RepID=A0A7U3ZI61_RUNSL|nr:N-acetylmuramidase domain-containing protein [Runella slithyformis]AEI47674.1 hypothetical protein Runsl_1247 [Runella slithyformis DSM 19594]
MALTAIDWANAAARLKCTVSIIRAVAQKESSGKGFYVTGALKQRFEPHIFKRRTGQTASSYVVAYALNPVEAMNSTSWGMFQIMGFNFKAAGYSSVEAMLADYRKGEKQQLNSFVTLILDWGLDDELRNKKYAAFAARYNGPKYSINNYDVDLEKFDKQFAANPLPETADEKKK